MKPEDAENQAKLDAYLTYDLPRAPALAHYPNGWMSPFDLQVIYNAARKTKGDILEIGPWLGRSSTAISLGVADRISHDGKDAVQYDLIDFGITGPDEWKSRFGTEFDFSYDKGRVARAILHPGGSNAVLIENLRRLDLLKYSNAIIRGDLIHTPIQKKYQMVFCDALHTAEEIARTMPKLAKLLAKGSTLVADDVVTEGMAEQICSYLDVRDYFFSRTSDVRRRRKICVFGLN